MHASEFDEAWDDDLASREREEQQLGEVILAAPIRDLMLERGLGAVLVQRDGRTVGIFTERDVLRRVVSCAVAQDQPVSEVMTPDPDSLGPDDGVAFALNRMIVGGFRHIPIVDDEGEPVAMLSQRDVVAFIVSRMPKRILNLPPDPRLEARTPDGG